MYPSILPWHGTVRYVKQCTTMLQVASETALLFAFDSVPPTDRSPNLTQKHHLSFMPQFPRTTAMRTARIPSKPTTVAVAMLDTAKTTFDALLIDFRTCPASSVDFRAPEKAFPS